VSIVNLLAYQVEIVLLLNEKPFGLLSSYLDRFLVIDALLEKGCGHTVSTVQVMSLNPELSTPYRTRQGALATTLAVFELQHRVRLLDSLRFFKGINFRS
jgi:hypothetical protein